MGREGQVKDGWEGTEGEEREGGYLTGRDIRKLLRNSLKFWCYIISQLLHKEMNCMDPSRILRNLLYGQIDSGSCSKGHPALRYRDVCKRLKKLSHYTQTLGAKG